MEWGEEESEMEQKKGTQRAAPHPEVKMMTFSADSRKVVTSQAFEKKQRMKGGKQTLHWQSRIKVWDTGTAQLLHVFKDHDQAVYVLEPHPTDPRVVASGGYDGVVIFWDIDLGQSIRKFHCRFEVDVRLRPKDFDQRSAEILDGKWGPDGTLFVVTHNNGYSSVISADARRDVFGMTLKEQFFETDFGELITDAHMNVIDRQAQVPPHTMAPGRLCDRFGTAHVLDTGMLSVEHRDAQPQLVAPPRVNRRAAAVEELEEEEEDADFVAPASDAHVSGDQTKVTRKRARDSA